MNALRHASFFSGVGGLDLGFENAGIRTVSLCEFEPYASAVLAERFPGVPNFGDITKIKDEEVPDAEIYSGGFPCQDLSTAGARRGFTEGTRSSLAFRFLDIVERRRPRWFVLENVPGLFSSNQGRDFGRLIREVESLGYGLAWRTLDARFFGVAQRRRRVFIVAARDDAFGGVGGQRAAEVLFECEGVCGHLASGESTREETPPDAREGVGTFGAEVANAIIARHGKGINSTVEAGHIVANTIQSSAARNGARGDGTDNPIVHSSPNAGGVRGVDGVAEGVDDCEGLEDSRRVGNFELYDFPKEAIAPTLTALRAKDGMIYESGSTTRPKVEFVINDTRPINKAENGAGFSDKDIAYTLTRVDQQGVVVARFGDECPACRKGEVECEPYADFTGVDVECSLCWDTGTVRPYGSEPAISFPSRFGSNAQATEEIAQSFAHSAGAPAVFRKAKRAQTSDDHETWVDDGIANTLNSFDATDVRTTHAVIQAVGSEVMSFPRSLSNHATKFNDQSDPLTVNAGGGVNTPAVLRTGTFFDGFNQSLEEDGARRTLRIGRDSSDFVVPPDGIAEDDDPLNPIGLDSNRYRCIGNGVVAPVAEFIGRRIVAVDAKYWKEANG
jgi:DNA-cytosine methyltransferase